MRRSLSVALGLFVVTTITPLSALAAGPCEMGEALLRAGFLEEAHEAFVEAGQDCLGTLPDDPASAPDRNGVSRVKEQKLQAAAFAWTAETADKAKQPAEAIAAYAKAVALDRSQSSAATRLAELLGDPAPANPYKAAQDLANLGFDTEARAATVKVVEAESKKASPATPPPDLKYLLDDPANPVRDVGRAIEALPGWFSALGVAALALLIGGLWFGYFRPKRFTAQRRLEFGEIADAQDGAITAPMKAVMADEIAILRREAVGNRLGFMTGPDPEIKIPVDLVEAIPYGKALSSLIGLVKTPPWTLTGALLWDPTRGPGLALALIDPTNKVVQQDTIWDAEFRPPDEAVADEAPESFTAAHARLGRAAASWLAYARATNGPERNRLEAAAGRTWRSYALFRVGAELQAAGEVPAALALYGKSRSSDPHNPGANFNAGFLRLDGKRQPGESATAYLTDARRLFDRVRDALATCVTVGIPNEQNALYFRYLYNAALLDYETALATGASASDWDKAVDASRQATLRAAEAARSDQFSSDGLRSFVLLVEDSSLALFGGALARCAVAGGAA